MPTFRPGKYKTFSGAAQRAAFERSMNPSEYAKGYAAHLYDFRVVMHEGFYRVEKIRKKPDTLKNHMTA